MREDRELVLSEKRIEQVPGSAVEPDGDHAAMVGRTGNRSLLFKIQRSDGLHKARIIAEAPQIEKSAMAKQRTPKIGFPLQILLLWLEV